MNYNHKDIRMTWVDLDDTLIDFTANAHAALVLMYQAEPILQQLFPSAEDWAQRYERHNMALWAKYNIGQISRDFLRMERFRLPLTDAGLPDSEARRLSSRYDTYYLDLLATRKRLIPDAIPLLETLRRLGSSIGILSNGFREVQYRKMDATGLTPYIDIVVLSDDIGINKPDTRLFDYAKTRTAFSQSTSHLMIGDNPDTDIAGALKAGWSAIWYNRNNTQATQPQDATQIST
ncbi:MAG: YjjG family noncanonical pyrimidine nucleotidase, partial [Paramuribaculum sp.]|nr:YjjG family noncanonical pyrimidine nucleotidase [Paramuribaculum sp.]